MRLDPLLVLPREVSLKLFAYLDAISLGRAAQVSKFWKDLADDDLLWRTMCEQHIEKKCEKCGWGLPLLGEKKRKAGRTATSSRSRAPIERTRDSSQSGIVNRLDETDQEIRPFKRSKTESPAPSRANSPPLDSTPHTHSSRPRPLSIPEIPTTRPWKSVYCERLVIERNWRRGTYVSTILSGHTDSITCLQVAEDLPHPTFPILMTGSWDRSVRIWNLETGKEVGVLRGHTRGVRALQFDATKLVTGSMDSTLKIWNWRTGECMRTLRGHSDAVICLTYDKQLLISGSVDSTIRVWDFGTGEGYSLTGHTEWVNSVAIWDSKTGCGTGVDTPETPSSIGGSIGAFSNPEQAKASCKGKFLFSASDDMTIRVWDLYDRTCVRVLKGHVAQVQSLRVIEDHFSIPSSPVDNAVPLPSTVATTSRSTRRTAETNDDEDDNAPLFDPTTVPSRLPPSLSPAPTSHAVPTLCTLSLPTVPETSALPTMSFEGDKKPLIISASLDNTIKMWDVEGGLCKRTMFGHIEGVWDVDVDKLRIVSGSHDRTLKVSSLSRTLLVFHLPSSPSSREERRVDKMISQVWDKESGRCLHTLVGHTSAVTSVILRDQYVISGGDDGNVRIWNFASSKVM